MSNLNNVLELKGKRFVQANKNGNGGGAAMNSKVIVTSQHLLKLKDKIEQIKKYWQQESRPFNGVLISVHYNKIVAKSNRIAGLFRGVDSNLAIVGAKFNSEKTKHIITYFLDFEDLDYSVELLIKANNIMVMHFQNGITKSIFDNNRIIEKIAYTQYGIPKTTFIF